MRVESWVVRSIAAGDRSEDPTSLVRKVTYYVSPANSLCFMDGGIDLPLSRVIFPGAEAVVKKRMREITPYTNRLGRKYLPIGSSICFDFEEHKKLIVAPTMLLPQKVPRTRNAYWAARAVFYNIFVLQGKNLEDVDVLMTSFCCGYGSMSEEESFRQIMAAFGDYRDYQPELITEPDGIFANPCMDDQPKYYQNLEWFDVAPEEIERV